MKENLSRVILLTGAELRHEFFRKYIALDERIEVLASFCESAEKSLSRLVAGQEGNALRMMHLRAREQSEEDFFRIFVETGQDRSHPVFLAKGQINEPGPVETILALKPDLLVCYGASIIREPLLNAFSRRFLNIHLGLSPYYRGSGTNYWPLVNGEPEYAGTTFMHIDAGVDTGEVIHQIRARLAPGDTPVQIGNRLIVDSARLCRVLIGRWDRLEGVPQIPRSPRDRICKKKDYTEASVAKLYENFKAGLVSDYLTRQRERCANAPIVQNPALASPA